MTPKLPIPPFKVVDGADDAPVKALEDFTVDPTLDMFDLTERHYQC